MKVWDGELQCQELGGSLLTCHPQLLIFLPIPESM